MLSLEELAVQKRRAETARSPLAGPETPFIHNAWYVAALSADIGDRLSARIILGQSVLLYRSSAGEVAALQNRCGHRSFPLSEGWLEGDQVRCRYHGLVYGPDGLCRSLPDGSPTRGRFGVRRYPTVERPPLVWIWPGDPARAEAEPLPHPDWLGGEGWTTVAGYLHAAGSYVHLHENLLDLSHLSFLHAAGFGTPEYARAPIEVTIDEDRIEVWRHVECALPELYARSLGWEGARTMRHSGSRFVSPGLHVNTGQFERLDAPPGAPSRATVRVAQLLTPETATSTHYHFAVCRDFGADDAAVSEALLGGFNRIFTEDIEAMALITGMQALAGEHGGAFEFDIPTDRPGIEMRRRLRRMADAEAKAGKACA